MIYDRQKVIAAYTELSRLISIGAYDELDIDGSYREGGDDVLKSHDELEEQAGQAGLKFQMIDGYWFLVAMDADELREFRAAALVTKNAEV